MNQAEIVQACEAVTVELRDTYRIKRNTDFAFTVKYGQVDANSCCLIVAFYRTPVLGGLVVSF
jgi:hypothetical protein